MKIYVTGPDFFWKNLAKMIVLFWTFQENLYISFVWKCFRMKIIIEFQHSAKIAYVGKLWFSSYGQKWSCPIKFQYSLIVKILIID